jgi:hypothetical protein
MDLEKAHAQPFTTEHQPLHIATVAAKANVETHMAHG